MATTTVSVRRSTCEPGYVASALVREGGDTWYESRLYIGYRKRDVPAMFREAMKQAGYALVED